MSHNSQKRTRAGGIYYRLTKTKTRKSTSNFEGIQCPITAHIAKGNIKDDTKSTRGCKPESISFS